MLPCLLSISYLFSVPRKTFAFVEPKEQDGLVTFGRMTELSVCGGGLEMSYSSGDPHILLGGQHPCFSELSLMLSSRAYCQESVLGLQPMACPPEDGSA